MSKTTEFLLENQENLELYTSAITRAHGQHHPEVFQVREVYQNIAQKLAKNPDEPDISGDFAELKKITGDYFIPADVCPTFAATYQMLQKADQLQADIGK